MKNLRRWIISFIVVAFIISLVWVRFLYTPIVTAKNGLVYKVPQGTSIKSVISDLNAKGIVKNPTLMNILVMYRGDGKALKAGEYLLPKGTTPQSLLTQIITGTGYFYHTFTIVPGWTINDVYSALLKDNNIKHTLSNKLNRKKLMTALGHSELDPEGQFSPDTYYFAAGTLDTIILKRAFKAMRIKLIAAWQTREPNLPYASPNEALIAASLVEKEAYLATERPKIAGVLINRLQKNMLLQFDPTVIYGMGSLYNGNIRKEDLITDTAYNTYMHKGLPPTPIAMPSADSIIAALHPEHHLYLYFVARGDGSHQFSETLEQHITAVNETKKLQSSFLNEDLLQSHLMYFFYHFAFS